MEHTTVLGLEIDVVKMGWRKSHLSLNLGVFLNNLLLNTT